MRAVKASNTSLGKDFKSIISGKWDNYASNFSNLPGKPDIVFLEKKLSIFLDSCFWHGCKLHCRIPQTNNTYWIKKINGNKKHDKEVNKLYKKMGWRVIRFWEHSIKNKGRVISKLEKHLGKYETIVKV